MKKYFLTILFLISTLQLINAQITLTASNNMEVGESYFYKPVFVTSFDPGASGANVVWDFSGLIPMTPLPTITQVVEPTTLTNNDLFPDANIGIQKVGKNDESYHYTSNEAQGFYGEVSYIDTLATYIIYSDPQDWLRYPMTYEDEFQDTFSGTGENNEAFDRNGTTEVRADAYGTLISPSGVFNNVLRVHTEMEYTNEFNNYGVDYIISRFVWYDKEIGMPLMKYQKTNIEGLEFHLLEFIDALTINTSSPLTEEINLSVFPNPTADWVNIEYVLKENADVNISVCNLLGQEVLIVSDNTQNTGSHQIDVNLSDLPKGTYFVKITIDNQVATHQVLVQK